MPGPLTASLSAREVIASGIADLAFKMESPERLEFRAGQFVSRGKAQRAEGGFQVQGRFQFGSGIARATWVGGGALVKDGDGSSERNDAGLPKVLAFVVPSESVEITGNWASLFSRSSYFGSPSARPRRQR